MDIPHPSKLVSNFILLLLLLLYTYGTPSPLYVYADLKFCIEKATLAWPAHLSEERPADEQEEAEEEDGGHGQGDDVDGQHLDIHVVDKPGGGRGAGIRGSRGGGGPGGEVLHLHRLWGSGCLGGRYSA